MPKMSFTDFLPAGAYRLRRAAVMTVGVLFMGFAVAALAVFVVAASLYMTADLGTAPYDAMSFVLAATLPHLPFRAVRMTWDAVWVVLTLVLGGSVGPVTIGIMLLMGPAVDLVGGWAKRTLYRG